MRSLNIFLYEWKHFVRNPFKLVAILLFVIAGIYGLQNGSVLYHEQSAEIEKIKDKTEEDRLKYLKQFEEGKLVDQNRPWVDMSTPFWAIWNTPTYHLKTPTPAMVYSIGQAEQYGFYKRVTFWASPYDADMAEEIANPERLQIGTLDFAFVLLFLLPLLLLILFYNIKSAETEQGFLSLVEVQTTSKNKWLFARILFYVLLTVAVISGLLVYGAMLSDVFNTASTAFGQMLLYSMLYLIFWSLIFFFILKNGKSILGNTLQMVGIWLLFAFVIPAIVHQSVSILKPANLMTDFIEVRDKQEDLYANDSLFQQKLVKLFPDLLKSPVYQDSTKINIARNQSASALVNELKKESIRPFELESEEKNKLIQATYWFNPMSFFQNKLNRITQTHYTDYQQYRNDIQALIDKRTAVLVKELWNDAKVDKEKYLEYNSILSIKN
jgi:ABC-2 type transport system permease protein